MNPESQTFGVHYIYTISFLEFEYRHDRIVVRYE